jgi:membrane fusion protein (multidrug efflux system)
MNSQPMMPWLTRLLATIVALALAACGPAKTAAKPTPPQQVAVVTVHRSSVPVNVELPGRTSAHVLAQVRARVDGIVLKREFQEGGDVKAGQRLYQIDPAPYVAALNSATASLQRAEASLTSATALVGRYKPLVAANAVSKQDSDNAIAAQAQAAADVASAKAAVEMARINLGYTNVVAPIAGRIGPSLVTQGAYVQASAATLLATIQQIDPINVDLTQPSVAGMQLRRDAATGKLKLDGRGHAKVTLVLEDGSQYPLPGVLQFTDITVDAATGSVTLRAIFANPASVLLPGMFVRAQIQEGVDANAILVPQVGVTHDPGGHATALVVGSDNKVALRAIQATRTAGSHWVVDAGLADGERVIVAGVQKVQPGALVEVSEAQTPSAPMVAASAVIAQAK